MCTDEKISAILSVSLKLWQIFCLLILRKELGMAREGDLYKRIVIDDITFEIRYGYYEEMDRYGKYNDPIPIYPNFKEHPEYNNEGYPFVTAMQNICSHFEGTDKELGCYGCVHYNEANDLIGICKKTKIDINYKGE